MKRRSFISSVGAIALLVAQQQAANAILFSGAPASGSGSVLIKTLTVVNTSGSSTAANSHLPMFGIPIKKADLASGTYPILKTAGGTVIDATYIYLSKNPVDSSTIMMGCLARFPDAIAGSGTASLKVYSGGSAPSASSRTLSEAYSENIFVEAVGHATSNDNLSGTWTADLQSANLVETIVIGDGPAGKIWKLTVPFKQSGSDHGQLFSSFYLMALQDGSGNLAGWRVLPCIRQPKYNNDTPAKVWRGFASLKLKYGAGPTVFDPIANSYSAKNFTWSGASNILNSTAFGMTNGCAVRLTTTGTLPTGLSTNTTYWIYKQTDDSFQFLDGFCSGATNQGTSVITVTGSGSGTHTMTPCDYAAQFEKKYMATTEGKYIYFQGAGSVATEPTLRVQHDTAYDHTTKLLPPFRLSVSAQVTSCNSRFWAPQGIGDLTDYIGGTGERDDIGLIDGYQSKHFFKQAAVDERMVRIVGLAQGHYAIDLKNGSFQPLNFSQGSYTGFPSSVSGTVSWGAFGGSATGFTAPTGGGKLCAPIFRGPDPSHETSYCYYAWLTQGEPQYYEMLLDLANIYRQGTENFTVGATTYYAMMPAGKDSCRTGAWMYRACIQAATVVADTSPDGVNWRDYMRDWAASQSTYLVAYLGSLNSWIQGNGFWQPQSMVNGRAIWQIGYLWYVACFHAAAMNDSNALTFTTHLSKWPPFVRTLTSNLWCMMTYYEISSTNNNTYGVPLPDADGYWGPWANVNNLSWVASTDVFTWNTPNWTPANGDKVMFWSLTKPAGAFSFNTQYYAVSTSGSTFKLSATLGGSPIDVTADGDLFTSNPGGELCYPQFAITVIPANPPSTGGIHGFIYDAGYAANIDGCIKYSLALGITTTGLSDCSTELDSRLSGVTWATPKYCMQTTF